MMAHYLKNNKPNSKNIILDQKEEIFETAAVHRWMGHALFRHD